MNIRQAVPEDSRDLSSLCMDVQSLHAAHHPDIFKMPAEADFAVTFFDEMLVDPTVSIFVAEQEGIPYGYVLCRIVERPENTFTHAMRYLLVDQISVRPAAQGRKVGTELLKQVDLWAKELGLQKIQLDSWGFNRKAHEFFERTGFEKFMIRFWRFV
jgi:GNAT superfamily N-acetyltransferase